MPRKVNELESLINNTINKYELNKTNFDTVYKTFELIRKCFNDYSKEVHKTMFIKDDYLISIKNNINLLCYSFINEVWKSKINLVNDEVLIFNSFYV